MKNRFVTGVLAGSLMLCSFGGQAFGAGSDRWVSSSNASLKSEPKASSTTLVDFAVGDKLTEIRAEGRWVLVKTADGKEGWIYGGRISSEQPQAEVEAQGGLLAGAMTKSNVSAAKADSSRSIRGLSPETEAYANSKQTPQQIRTSLDQILAYSVTPEELERFLVAGKLGEYAE